MRHAKARLQLNRFTSWRKATIISLAKALIIQQSIRTTKTRAKAVKPFIEKLITLGKKNTLSAKRRVYKMLGSHKLVGTIFNDIAPRFVNRIGGYTRILNFGVRRGDNAHLVILSLTEIKEKKPKEIKPKGETKTGISHKDEIGQEKTLEEKKPKAETIVKEKPPEIRKPAKKFLGGLRKIFKKKSDSL